jgi:hypothetical protein
MITTSAQYIYFLTNFHQSLDLKNMISTYTKEFSWKKWRKMTRFCFWFFFKSPDFNDKFQYVAKNIERLLFFILSYLVRSQIWLNYFWMIATLAKHLKETLLELLHKIGKGPSLWLWPLPSSPPPPLHTLSWRIWNLVCCWHVPKQRSLGGLILG